ncbi:MAG: hypothetical protein ACQESC_01045 [Nanobdellota archaeon]
MDTDSMKESPLKPYDAVSNASKCSGCRSCGGGCYGCKVTEDMLESKVD